MESLPNILIVDDTEENLHLLEIVLRNLKVNLISAYSGPEALRRTKGMELAMAILDIRMPVMSGYELASRLNENSVNKVPVIFLTANILNETDIYDGFLLGAVDTIFRPIQNHILLSKVMVFLDLFKQKQTIIKEAELLKKSTEELAKINEALKKSEGRLNDIIFSMADWVWETDENGVYTYVSENVVDVLGLTKDEMIGKTPFDFMAPAEQKRVSELFSEILKNKAPIKYLQNWNVRKDGKPVCFITNGVPIFDENRNLKGYRGVDRDITHPIELEESLHAHRIELEMQNDELRLAKDKAEVTSQKYTDLYNFAPSGYFTLSASKEILELNNTGSNILGLSHRRTRLVDNHFDFFISNETLPVFDDFFEKAFKSRNIEICELVLETEDYEPKYVHVEGVVSADGKNCLLNVVDISERKQAEELLQQSQSTLEVAQRIAHIGSWEWDMISNTVKWSKEMFRVFDIDPDKYDGKPESLLKVIHPNDIALFTNSMNNNITAGNSPSLEYRVVHRNGSVQYVSAEGRSECDIQGKPVRMVGTVQDITERKRVEEDLRQANSFLDSILENIPDMLFIKDAKDLRYVRFNRAGENLLGISRKDLIGRNDYDVFPKEQADRFANNDRNLILSRGMTDTPEEAIHTRNKGVRLLHTRKVAILDTQGEPQFLLGISEDITELKLVEQTLKISEEKYRTMLNASPDGILLIDLNGIITEASEIGLELFGIDTRDDLVGHNFNDFIAFEEIQSAVEIFEKTMNEGLAQNIGLMIKKKNQSLFFSEISTTLIQDRHGEPLSFMLIIRDITQRKKTETKRLHADRMVNLGEMASGMAHEINQPLNIISMVLDKILFETAKTKTLDLEFLHTKSDKIFENITRIRNIIDHVRAFSRNEDNYVLTAFDLNASIGNAISMISEQFKHLGIRLDLKLNKKIPTIFGNTFKFEQVIVNLLVNAKDAVIEKKRKHQEYSEMIVGICTYLENQFLIVEITDNGIGINKEDIHDVMLPFYTTKDEGKGTGLGLSISYQIIQEMNGSIELFSNPEDGTKIKLILDLQNKNQK